MSEVDDSEFYLRVSSPIYLLVSSETCWKCGKEQSVIALGSHCVEDDGMLIGDCSDKSDLVLLTNIGAMAELVFDYVTSKHSRYIKKYSKAADETYYANVCECGANFGDFYLFSEPGGAFFPETVKDAASIRILKMPFEGEFEFECTWAEGSGRFILEHGTLVT